ncbi:MAG: 4Fe-4S binding protein [Candidatus Sulfomarinibacteraceae bacterium]
MRLMNAVRRITGFWPAVIIAVICALAMTALGIQDDAPAAVREISITARQYGFEPHRIFVNPGDIIELRLVSVDVVHGFFLEGHDIEAEIRPGKLAFKARHPSKEDELREVESLTFVAGSPGKYRYRCSVTCGTLHPFMQGEFIVRPNLPYRAGVVGTWGVALSAFALMLVPPTRARRRSNPEGGEGWRVDLLARFGWLEQLVRKRWFQFAVVVPNVLILFFFIVAGLVGSPIGNRNIVITIVWILWWFLLITLLVPLGGRIWCMACPLPFFGEWFSRRRLLGVRPGADRSGSVRSGSLNRSWPRRLSGTWIQNILFLTLCTVSTILVTRPALTAFVLGGMLLVAVVVHAVFRRRSFCRFLCPLNSWMGLYSMTAMTEVRTRDPSVCESCGDHSCIVGSSEAWGCPWLVNPSKLSRNNHCGLCMECIKACPNDNLTVRMRPFCSDTAIRRYDEAWMAFIMIALVIAYSVTLLGPWATVKEWANVTEIGNWGGFALHSAVVWFASLVAVPAIWYAAALIGRPLGGVREIGSKEIFVRYSYVLVPLGLAAWAAFSFPLVMVNFSHVISSLSDPLGWGWDLFGTADQIWRPLWPEWIPYLQIPLLLLGLGAALSRGAAIARDLFGSRRAAVRSLIPHGVVCTVITLVMLRLFVG